MPDFPTPTESLDLARINDRLRGRSPSDIIRWALALKLPTIATTSMGVNAGATLHAVSRVDPSVPVIWVDSGFHLRDTYDTAARLTDLLGLNLKVFRPRLSPAEITARLGGIPTPDEVDAHADFTDLVKLEPFERALAAHRPRVWISGIRADETEFRRGLDIVSRDHRGIIKVAPFYEFSEAEVEDYMRAFGLPSCRHYFDPTKVDSARECGLHTRAPRPVAALSA